MAELKVKIGADISDLQKKLKTAEGEFKKLEVKSKKTGKAVKAVFRSDISDLLDKFKITKDELAKLAVKSAQTGRSIKKLLAEQRGSTVEKTIDGVTDSVQELQNEAKQTGSTLQGGFTKSSTAAINLRGGVEGLIRQMISFGSASAKGGVALKAALISTGIGALIVALGLVIANWDKIFSGISKANKALLQQRHIIETTLGLRDARIELIRAEQKLLEATGGDTSVLIGREKKLLQAQIDKNKELIKTKTNLRNILKAEEEEITLLEDLGNVVGISPFSQENRDQIDKYKVEIDQAATSVAGLQTELFKLNNPDTIDLTVDLGKVGGGKVKDEILLNPLDRADAEAFASDFFDGIDEIAESSGANLKDSLKDQIRDALKGLGEESDVDLDFLSLDELNAKLDVLDGRKIDINFDAGFESIKQNIAKVKELQQLINSFGLDIDIGSFNLDTSGLEDLKLKLEEAAFSADLFAGAISASFSTLTRELTENLNTGIGVLDAFIGAVITGIGQMLAQLLSQLIAQSLASAAIGSASATAEGAIAITKAAASGLVAKSQGVAIATSAASALGPYGVIALPGLLAVTQAQILAALTLAKIPSFAHGGFSGDDNLAFLNKNELVLRPQEQAALFNAIRGKNLGNLANNPTANSLTDGVIGEVILRGNTQVIQLRRAKKKMSRYYNS